MKWTDFVHREPGEAKSGWRLYYFGIALNCSAPVLHSLYWNTLVPLHVWPWESNCLARETFEFIKDYLIKKLDSVPQGFLSGSNVSQTNEYLWKFHDRQWRLQYSGTRVAIRAWRLLNSRGANEFFITMKRELLMSENRGLYPRLPAQSICGDYAAVVETCVDAFFNHASERLSQQVIRITTEAEHCCNASKCSVLHAHQRD